MRVSRRACRIVCTSVGLQDFGMVDWTRFTLVSSLLVRV